MGWHDALRPTIPSISWTYRRLGETSRIQRHPATFPAKLGISRSIPRLVSDPGVQVPWEQKLAALKAILFLAKTPLSSRKLAQFANLADGTEARTLVTQINLRLDQEGRAFRVETVAGGYLLVTRPQFAKWLRRLDYVPSITRLSNPAMETLSVVAYRQPVLRADVEAVRGVGCGEMLAQLLNRDLIRISGRSEELGRPYLYSTTKRFLLTFGLRSLDELPGAELFRTPDAPSSFDGTTTQVQQEEKE